MPTPRHASHAAIDPVETVTPPTVQHSLLDEPMRRRVRAWANWLVLQAIFYAKGYECHSCIDLNGDSFIGSERRKSL